MANAVIRGGGVPLEINGTTAPGISFQNLGTAPVYIGLPNGAGSSVSSASFDGVIAAGGTASVGGKQSVHLYADTDTPLVWNFDSAFSSDSGSQVTASVAGSVAVSNTPTVINGGGTVNAFGLNSYTSIVSNGNYFLPAGSPEHIVFSNRFVGDQQCVLFGFANNNQDNGAIAGIRLDWSAEIGGPIIHTEEVEYYAGGGGYCVVPIKAPYLTFTIFLDYTIYGTFNWNIFNVDIGTSNINIPEMYYGRPSGSGAAMISNTGMTTVTIPNNPPSSGGVMQIIAANTAAASATAVFLLPSYARLVNGIIQYSGFTTAGFALTSLQQAMKNVTQANYAILNARTNSGLTSIDTFTYYTAEVSKTPLALTLQMNNAQVKVTLAYQRF